MPRASTRIVFKPSAHRHRADTHGWMSLDNFNWATSRMYKSIDIGLFVLPRSLYVKSYSAVSGFISVPLDSLSISLFVLRTAPTFPEQPLVLSTVSQVLVKNSNSKTRTKKNNGRKRQKVTQSTSQAPFPAAPSAQDSLLSRIMEMGYAKDLATSALAAVRDPNDLQAALEWLLNRDSSTSALQSAGFEFYDPALWDKAAPTSDAVISTVPRQPLDNVSAPAPSATTKSRLLAKQSGRRLETKRPSQDIPLSWTDTRRQLVGFYNPNIKCYINAVIQCLSASVPFADLVLSEPRAPGTASDAFAKVLTMIRKPAPSRAIRLDEFRNSWIPTLASRFDTQQQEDASEFFLIFITLIGQDLAVAKYPDFKELQLRVDSESAPSHVGAAEAWRLLCATEAKAVRSMFSGLKRERISCGSCKATSTRFDEYFPFPLCFPPGVSTVNLLDLIKLISVPEHIDWRCPTKECQGAIEKNRTMQSTIARLPPILMFHLVRFVSTDDYGDYTKNHARVKFPLKGLDLSSEVPTDDNQCGPQKYDLFGVICHHGHSLRYGHYTSYVCLNGKWYLADDHNIEQVSEDVVARAQAYMLFYRRVD
ncbi:ubiquitin-specific protease doa4 [Tulasnella sp. 419]|nr:ubiquitin-specific protease doa4 [Tulasnella sp. 419]